MVSRLKISAIIVGLTFGLAGCAQDLARINNDLTNLNAALAGKGTQPNGAQTGGMAMAAQPEAGQSKPTQLIIPKDKRTAAAIDEAMPTIKKILAIHQCLKDFNGLRQMNIYAVPGVDMARVTDNRWSIPNAHGGFGNQMQYHDLNKCVSVTTIDQFAMPALNTLQFRAVYFADDSGETVNFKFEFKKMDDGSWKIDGLCSRYGCSPVLP